MSVPDEFAAFIRGCNPESRPRLGHWWRRTWPQLCVWRPEWSCGQQLRPQVVDLEVPTRGRKEIGGGGRGRGRSLGDKGPKIRARSMLWSPLFLRSKEARRKARANSSSSSRTSKAEDVVVDRVDDLHVSCATARTTWCMTALTGSWRREALKKVKKQGN